MTVPDTTMLRESTPAPKRASVWEDFVDIFASPSEVFARRQNGGFALPLLVLTLAMTALFFGTRSLLTPIFDAESSRQIAVAMKANPQMTQEQAQGMRGMTERMGGIFGGIAVLVIIPLTVLLIGVNTWISGKPFGSVQTIRSAFVVATYSYFPKLIESVVSGIQGLLLDEGQMTSLHSIKLGITRFMDPDAAPVLTAFLGRLDLFTIWVTILIGIGLRITGKLTAAQAAGAAVLVWLLGSLPALLSGLRAAG
ncbi:MAG: YIP1 family protein [Gemmatimonadaceae bacterium]